MEGSEKDLAVIGGLMGAEDDLLAGQMGSGQASEAFVDGAVGVVQGLPEIAPIGTVAVIPRFGAEGIGQGGGEAAIAGTPPAPVRLFP